MGGKYKDEGLIVIGVHSPEFAFERDIANVKRANDFAIWRAFSNQYWPAHYVVDASWRETAYCIRAGSCSHSRLLPWISVKRKVTLAAARLASRRVGRMGFRGPLVPFQRVPAGQRGCRAREVKE